MCIAIVKRAGVIMKDEHLSKSFSYHPHGAGYAFVTDGKVEIRKGFMTPEEFTAAYRVDEAAYPESNFLLHFRTATGGGTTKENTHPFRGRECAVIHNGVFFSPPTGSNKSDTRILIEASAERLTKEAVTAGLEEMKKHVGYHNKMCFLFQDNTFVIVNEQAGDWEGGVWYSNRSYCGYRNVGSAWSRGGSFYGRDS